MRSHPKIRKACFHFNHLLFLMDQWEREGDKSAFFCKEHEISRLYHEMVNMHTLIGTSDDSSQINKQKFNDYCRKCISIASKADIEEISNKIKDGAGLVNYILAKKFLLDDINELLRATADPTKLEYLRWPVNQLYLQIKKGYKNAKITHPSCFSMLMFTRE